MRPSSEVVMINKGQTIDTLLPFIKEHRYTRYPVFDPSKNEVIGIFHVKDLLAQQDNIKHLDELIRPILKVSQHLPLKNLLSRFRAGIPHLALVYKEKRLVGFITMDNVLQVLLGKITDEFHRTHVDWVIHDNGQISVKGRCTVYALEQLLDKDLDVDENIETLAGLILDKLGSIPKEGDRIEFDDFDAVVEKMNVTQILNVTIYRKESHD